MRLIPVFIIPLAQCATFHRHDFESNRDTLLKFNIMRTGNWCVGDGYIDVGGGCKRPNVLVPSLRCWW